MKRVKLIFFVVLSILFCKSNIDVILSDMASNTTGNKSLDCIRTNQLCLDILEFSKEKRKCVVFIAPCYLHYLLHTI